MGGGHSSISATPVVRSRLREHQTIQIVPNQRQLSTKQILSPRSTSTKTLLTSSQLHPKPQQNENMKQIKILKLVASYCPNIVVSLLGDKNLHDPISITLNGACCLLADICGFTKYSGDLCQDGANGIDKLRRTTSSFLTKFIETIYFFYGDVMSFAGDALICLFAPRPEDHGDTRQCCLRAIHCGNQLKLLQTDTLSAHIAIDYGSARLALIGGYQSNWTYLFDGDCFTNLSSCLNEAGNQELVISSNLFTHIKSCSSDDLNNITLDELESGNYLINIAFPLCRQSQDFTSLTNLDVDLNEKTMKSLMVQQLRMETMKYYNPQLLSFIPQPVLSNIKHLDHLPDSIQSLSSSSELRQVTCIFMKFDNYTQEHLLEDLQHFFVNCQEIILQQGGFIRQLVVDDKGCVLIALWGVPTASHVNDAIRALSVTSKIKIFCQNHNYQVSMGVTTGDVYCGMIGSNFRCDYAAVGSSINMSARLMSKAMGKIYIDEQTNYYLQSSFENCSSKLPPMTFKGKNETVQVYEFLINQNFLQSLPGTVSSQTSLKHDSFFAPDIMKKLTNAVSSLQDWHGMIHLVEVFSNEETSQHHDNENDKDKDNNCLHLIQVTGTAGTGKTEVAHQLKQLCDTHEIPTIFITLCELDYFREFNVIRQIFTKFIGEDIYLDLTTQKEVITSLFFKTYSTSTNSKSFLKQKFDLIKTVLGLSWFPVQFTKSTRGISIPNLNLRDKLFGTGFPNELTNAKDELDFQEITSTFLEFFMTALTSKPRTIILDEAQYCDAASWSIIYHMLHQLRAPILYLLTMTEPRQSDEANEFAGWNPSTQKSVKFLTASNGNPNTNLYSKSQDHMISVLDPLNNDEGGYLHITEMLSNFKSSSHHTTIKLNGLSLRQVKTILQTCLKPENLTPSIIGMVTEISEGNAYWCKAIAEFISEYGEDSFCNTFCPEESMSVTLPTTLRSFCPSTLSTPPKNPLSNSRRFSRCSFLVVTSFTSQSSCDETTTVSQMETSAESLSERVADTVLYHLITSLMDRLTFQERELLKYAAVCGEKFHSDLLSLVISSNLVDQCDNTLSSLKKKKFISSSCGRMNFSFISYRMRDIIYSLIPSSDASRIHYLVGKNIEVLYHDKLEEFTEVLAFHYTMASMNHFQLSKEEFPNERRRSPNGTVSTFIQHLYDLIVRKSFHYSFHSALLLYRREKYQKALEYLKHACHPNAIKLLGESYRCDLIRLLNQWKCVCQQSSMRSIRKSYSSNQSSCSSGSQNLSDTYEVICELFRSIQ